MKQKYFYIRLSVRGTGKSIYLNPELVNTVEPEIEGCVVRSGNMSIIVDEKYDDVLFMIEEYWTNKNKTTKGE